MDKPALEKLRWRCIRRGLLEVDLALTRFLDEEFESLTADQQQLFVEIADMEDHDLWHLISGQAECDDPRYEVVLSKIRKH